MVLTETAKSRQSTTAQNLVTAPFMQIHTVAFSVKIHGDIHLLLHWEARRQYNTMRILSSKPSFLVPQMVSLFVYVVLDQCCLALCHPNRQHSLTPVSMRLHGRRNLCSTHPRHKCHHTLWALNIHPCYTQDHRCNSRTRSCKAFAMLLSLRGLLPASMAAWPSTPAVLQRGKASHLRASQSGTPFPIHQC